MTIPQASQTKRSLFSGRAVRAIVPLLLIFGAVIALMVSMSSSASASPIDLTASGNTLNSAEPIGRGDDGVILAKDPDAGGTANGSPCADTGLGRTNDYSQCLPIFRWGLAMQLQSNVQFTLSQPLDSVTANLVTKNSVTGIMSIGNLIWYAAAYLMNLATNYEMATTLMQPINGFAAKIGEVLLSSALLGGLAGIAIIGAFIAFMRRGFNAKRLLFGLGSVAAVAILVGGSMNDSGSGDGYKPGTGSPAWIAKTTSKIFQSATDPIARQISQSADKNNDSVFSQDAKSDPYSCYTYTEALYSGYNKGENNAAGPEIISRWWMNTSYKTFGMLQYGEDSTVGPDYALCHQLETASVEPRSHEVMTQVAVADAGGNRAAVPAKASYAMFSTSSDGVKVQQNNFWGLCGPTGADPNSAEGWKIRIGIPANRNGDSGASNDEGMIKGADVGGEISPGACAEVFKETPQTKGWGTTISGKLQDFFKGGENADAFGDIPLFVVGNEAILNDQKEGIASVPALYTFEGGVTGADRSASALIASVYLISALAGAIAIGALAIALLVMKTLSYVMAGFLILAALAGMLSQGGGSSGTFFKQWLGYTFITSITNLLMSFVFMMTAALTAVGDLVFSQALPMVMWLGFAPLLSIFLLNWVFRKFFKAASPFSMRGMQSYANNPMGVAAAAGGGAMLGKDLIDQGRRNLTNRAIGAGAGAVKSKMSGKDAGAQEDSEVIGKAQDASTGTDATTATQANVDAAKTGQSDGATMSASVGDDSEDGNAFGRVSDDDTIGQASDGFAPGSAAAAAAAGGSFADRVGAFSEGRGDRRSLGDFASDKMDSLKYAGIQLGRNVSAPAMALGAKLGDAGKAVAGFSPKGAVSAGMGKISDKWKGGADARKFLREHPGATASYLARRSATNLAKLGRGAVDTVSGIDKKSLLKGAALYGGLTAVTGGLAAPAAVFGAKALLKHRGAVAGGFQSAKSALTDNAKQAYDSYFPGKDGGDADMQFRKLQDRIDNARVHGIDGKPGVAADGSDIVGLGESLPLGRERMIDAERASVDREYDAFQADQGRAPDEREMEAIYARHPFANDARDTNVSSLQSELDLPTSVTTSHSNATATPVQGQALPSATVKGADVNRSVEQEGRVITQKTAQVETSQGPDQIATRRVNMEHDVNTAVSRGQDTIHEERTQIHAQTPGQTRVVDQVSHASSGQGSTNVAPSTQSARVETHNRGSYTVGSGAEAAAAARSAGISERDARGIGESVNSAEARRQDATTSFGSDGERRSFDPESMQASAINVESGDVTEDRTTSDGQEYLDIFGGRDKKGEDR